MHRICSPTGLAHTTPAREHKCETVQKGKVGRCGTRGTQVRSPIEAEHRRAGGAGCGDAACPAGGGRSPPRTTSPPRRTDVRMTKVKSNRTRRAKEKRHTCVFLCKKTFGKGVPSLNRRSYERS
ncbi:unnamed protein product [Leptosia nina]|uniref:Uncharacterized protein n=1 Tax=Leptosia nina TaxID=320188 RepID=A0AAV1JJN7_9NEOP